MFFEEKCFLMCSVYDCYLAVHTVLEVWIERLSKQRSYLSWENSGTVTCLSTNFFSQCSNETMHTQPQDLHTSSDYIIFVWLCLPMCVWVCLVYIDNFVCRFSVISAEQASQASSRHFPTKNSVTTLKVHIAYSLCFDICAMFCSVALCCIVMYF